MNGGPKAATWTSERNEDKKNGQPSKKVCPPTSSQVQTQAKTAITSCMLSFCFTSIAFQSLLPCPWDIERIFHSTVGDWHWAGKGGERGRALRKNGWVRQREENDSTYVPERKNNTKSSEDKWRMFGRYWIESGDNLGRGTCALMAQWIESWKQCEGKAGPVMYH